MITREEINKVHALLKEYILTLPRSKRIHEDEYVTECIFCGDSQNHKNHAHLYIGFKDDGNIGYFCHRCPAHGFFSVDLLNKFQCRNEEIINFFKKLSKKKYTKSTYLSTPLNKKDLNINYRIPKHINPQDLFKKDYFEKRTGIKLTQNLVSEYSIIFNLLDFLNENNIPLNSYKRETQFVIKELSKNFLGFLSANKSIISFRAVRNTKFSKNKFNFVINENYKLPFYYSPGANIDLLTIQPKIVLAEGTFDIICIKERFFPKDTTDTVFAAVGGKTNYKKILREIIHKTGFLNAFITIFSDKDVNVNEYLENVLSQYKDLLHGRIIFNELSKDFGEIDIPFKFKIYKF